MLVHQYLDDWAREQTDAEFAVQLKQRLTYGEAADAVNRLAQGIVHSGIEVGERVGLLARNRPECVLLALAVSKAGVVLVLLNPDQTPNQWAYALNDSGVTLLFSDGEFVPAVNELRSDVGSIQRFISLDEAELPDGWEDWRSWLEREPPTPIERPAADALYQLYTSGTTGQPKGVVLSHSGVTAMVSQAIDPKAQGLPGERWLLVTGIFHISGMLIALHSVCSGGSLYILRTFDPHEAVRALSEENIVGTVMAPAMLQACLTMVPNVAGRPYDKLRLIAYGGSPIAEGTLVQLSDVFPCDFAQIYASTEFGLATCLGPEDHHRALTGEPALLSSAGRPVPGVELRIVDDEGNSTPAGAVGEIIVRSPQLMLGYWNRPEETSQVLQDGWLHSGDVGFVDDGGYLYVRDRIRDVIITRALNVYPVMVEDVLQQHPAVAEAAVVAVPDPHTGEAVKAVVILRDGSEATEQELLEFCAPKLGEYQRPASVDFADTFPRNSMGKVLKRVLREPYWAGQERRVGGA